MNIFGSIIIGPSGSGKTTLCYGLNQFFNQLNRKHKIINLDPANEEYKYPCDIDIKDLINIDDVMEELKLGPNGSLLYCFDFLLENIDWLLNKLSNFKDNYIIIDMPGQIELYLNSQSVKQIIQKLTKNDNFSLQLVGLCLFDSINCYDATNYIAMSLFSVSIMINLELPHINVLSKIDLLKEFGRLPNRLSMYLEGYDIQYISEEIKSENSKFSQKYQKLNDQFCELIDNYNLNGYIPLQIMDKISVGNLIKQMDKANGFFYSLNWSQNEQQQDIREAIFQEENLQMDYDILEEQLFGFDDQEISIEKDMNQIKKFGHFE